MDQVLVSLGFWIIKLLFLNLLQFYTDKLDFKNSVFFFRILVSKLNLLQFFTNNWILGFGLFL